MTADTNDIASLIDTNRPDIEKFLHIGFADWEKLIKRVSKYKDDIQNR